MSLGNLELHDHSNILFLLYIEVVLWQLKQLIKDFTGPRDDFMVHGVNNP